MTPAAELPLLCSASALAAVAVLLSLPRGSERPRRDAALLLGVLGTVAPLLFFPLLDRSRATGRALWEWSAAGGPTIQASYGVDGIGAIGVALNTAYATAGLLAAAKARGRSPLLPGLVLAIGLTSIALDVTADLVASTVVLGVLAALTAFAAMLVAPPPAAARLAAYFALGVQGFVIAALLASRFGVASFQFQAIPATAISPGTVLVASLGGALFAGLYPFVPWRYRRAQARAAERERLRGLLAMPAGIGASLVLLRLLGVTHADLTEIALPGVPESWRLVAAVGVAIVAALAARRSPRPARALVAGAIPLAALAAYPLVHWSHVVLLASLVTVLYAAAVSLALPEQWIVVRYDVALAGFWIALALGTPTSIAAGLVLLAATAATAIGDAIWITPHRVYVALVSAGTLVVGSVLTIGLGALAASDRPSQALALLGLVAVLVLELLHLSRRLDAAPVPLALDATAGIAAFLVATLIALVLAPPLYEGVTVTLGRPFAEAAATAPLTLPAVVVMSTLIIAVARALRPLLPGVEPYLGRLRFVAGIADPVPAGVAGFRIVEQSASHLTAAFALFEQRAGVWLAALLIVALLLWSVR